MTINMITAARLLRHLSVNGKYQTMMRLDEFPILGHQMTHSIDSYITDSANSASALYSGYKSSVDAMGVHADSSPDPFDDPKVETIVEIFRRVHRGAWGAVSTAFLADATPAALTGHTRQRGEYGPLIDQALHGLSNYSWTQHGGPDVYFGGGAEHLYAGGQSYRQQDYYAAFADCGYSLSLNKTALLAADSSRRAFGVFCQSAGRQRTGAGPAGPQGEMTLKAVDVLHRRGGSDGFSMAEAVSIDKQMHALDYDRALGDLLELDDTVRATVDRLQAIGILDETLIIITADHGHGFDVWGSADTTYLAQKTDARAKRKAIGVYARAGLSEYTHSVPGVDYGTGPRFPVNWAPRYALAAGVGAAPDRREDYRVRAAGSRYASVAGSAAADDVWVNPADAPAGFILNGLLPPRETTGRPLAY